MTTTRERRGSGRVPMEGMVCYSDPFDTFNPIKHVTCHVGSTVNINTNGACILTKHYLERGAKLKLSFRQPGFTLPHSGAGSIIAQVRWCRKIAQGSYRTGLFWPDLS